MYIAQAANSLHILYGKTNSAVRCGCSSARRRSQQVATLAESVGDPLKSSHSVPQFLRSACLPKGWWPKWAGVLDDVH